MINTPETIIGIEASKYLEIVEILNKDQTNFKYDFVGLDFYEDNGKSIKEIMNAYWSEIILRAHLAAYTSVLRNHKWIAGCLDAATNRNYMSFAACFRGFIESAADTNHALRNIAPNIAENFGTIECACKGELNKAIVSSEMEELLIHYSHARKLSKGSEEPDYHRAKATADYLNHLENPKIKECYSHLCEITHPASATVGFFLDKNNEMSFDLNLKPDQRYINWFSVEYECIMLELMFQGFNPSLLILRVINELKIDRWHTKNIDQIQFDNIPAWGKMVAMIKNTRR